MRSVQDRCILCAGSSLRTLIEIHEPDRFEKSVGIQKEGYLREWLHCDICDLALNKIPESSVDLLGDIRNSYYEVDFSGTPLLEKYSRVMNLDPQLSDNSGRVARVENFVEQYLGGNFDRRALDIGAGLGVFLSRLVDQSREVWHCVAIEPDPQAADHLKKLNKFEVVEASLGEGPDFGQFSLVTLNKVLEHLTDPIGFLRLVLPTMAPSGSVLYVEVPDLLSIESLPSTDNILGSLHNHLYSPASLVAVLRAVGLEVLQVSRVADPSGKMSVYAFASLRTCLIASGFPRQR